MMHARRRSKPVFVGDVQIGGDTRPMRARRVSDEEKAALWPRLIAMYRDFDDYQGRTTRNLPVLRLAPR